MCVNVVENVKALVTHVQIRHCFSYSVSSLHTCSLHLLLYTLLFSAYNLTVVYEWGKCNNFFLLIV